MNEKNSLEWENIIKSVNVLDRESVEIEARNAPKNLFAQSLAKDIFVYNRFDKNNEIASGIFLVLYSAHEQKEWGGKIRIVTQSKSAVEPELAVDPLLPDVSMSWFNEHFKDLNLINLKGTSTVQNTIKFSTQKTVHNLETKISWTVDKAKDISKHFKTYIDYLEELGGQTCQ